MITSPSQPPWFTVMMHNVNVTHTTESCTRFCWNELKTPTWIWQLPHFSQPNKRNLETNCLRSGKKNSNGWNYENSPAFLKTSWHHNFVDSQTPLLEVTSITLILHLKWPYLYCRHNCRTVLTWVRFKPARGYSIYLCRHKQMNLYWTISLEMWM